MNTINTTHNKETTATKTVKHRVLHKVLNISTKTVKQTTLLNKKTETKNVAALNNKHTSL